MAVCVTLTPEGTLVPTGEPASQCGGYVLVSGAEHAQASILIELFQWPEPEVATGWFSGVFTLVHLELMYLLLNHRLKTARFL